MTRGREFTPRHRFRRAPAEAGSVSILFMVMVLPFLCALLTLTIDLSHYFGIRDEVQRVIDREAHDALVAGKAPGEVERSLRARLRNGHGLASISSVHMSPSQGANAILVTGEYRGAFSELAQRLYGKIPTALTFAARAQVRIQRSAALVILDRSLVAPGRECDDDMLQAMGLFADRLADSWASLAGTSVTLAVSPGVREAIEEASPRGIDQVPRCAFRSLSGRGDLGVVRGVVGANPYSSSAVAYQAQMLAIDRVLLQQVRARSVVVLARKDSYERGYVAQIYSAISDSARGARLAVDFYTFIADDYTRIDSKPYLAGISGGAVREIGVSQSDLRGAALVSAVTQTITDRVVLER
jgi:hypothetical protein